MSAELTPQLLLTAYMQGYFPMADLEDGAIYWYDPDPRAIIPLDERFHVSRRLARTVRQGKFEIRVDHAFEAVMRACAAPTRHGGWISESMIAAYVQLHALGFAHSVETWQDGVLVGGLYGVTVRGLFAGESMFSHTRDASKIALVHLVGRLRRRGYLLLDTQFMTEHLAQFGTFTVDSAEYRRLLSQALQVAPTFV